MNIGQILDREERERNLLFAQILKDYHKHGREYCLKKYSDNERAVRIIKRLKKPSKE